MLLQTTVDRLNEQYQRIDFDLCVSEIHLVSASAADFSTTQTSI